ncbi:MAG: excinuclease ABC subunit UvrB, partial [bacterium]|nr:excinuclease ABC subunit UvrB [bacterium]
KEKKLKRQVLLGVTGSGKTFTMAHIIKNLGLPTLVISPNKLLAAQLYAEFKAFFPLNAVEYFISYYDYYQPESYLPAQDIYIEKDASINEQIEQLRLKATQSLIERKDVIVVASVSCIYGLGNPRDFKEMAITLEPGRNYSRKLLSQDLAFIHYERTDTDFLPGKFRLIGDYIDIFASTGEFAYRVEISNDRVKKIQKIDPITGKKIGDVKHVKIYPNTHYSTSRPTIEKAVEEIKKELAERVKYFEERGEHLKAERIRVRTEYDIEMLLETGYCHGIENYSRYLTGRFPGERPACLIDFFPDEFLVIIDESHITIPQIRGMYNGDRSRKETLVEYGFRLPSALDNRPLKFEEFDKLLNYVLYVSATPSEYEIKTSDAVVEQIVRPTGIVDPPVYIKSSKNQIEDTLKTINEVIKENGRVILNATTKKTSEIISEFLQDKKIKAKYLHSDIDAIERVKIINELRTGEIDVIVGVNLLREGLDLPEVECVLILDADYEGFLRSKTALIQLAGRCARNTKSKIIIYADKMTKAIVEALSEMERRRKIQLEYNKKHNITPKTVEKEVRKFDEFYTQTKKSAIETLKESMYNLSNLDLKSRIKFIETEMKKAAELWDFETAIILRDELKRLKEMEVKA